MRAPSSGTRARDTPGGQALPHHPARPEWFWVGLGERSKGVPRKQRREDREKEVGKMSLSPFGRRGGFYDAHSEVNRLLDEMFGGLGRRPGGRGAQATVEWAPSVDVLQKDGDLMVRVEMPGVKPEDVHVAVHNRVLTISGERKVDEEEERAGYYVRELRHGSFQ